MFSESEEDLSDDGGNNSPDSTSNIPNKRRRLASDSSRRSRSSTPGYSSQASSPGREALSDRDSEEEDESKQIASRNQENLYRPRSASISRSRSRSRSRSSLNSRSPSRSRSISRSVSPVMTTKKKRVVNSRSRSISRSVSPAMTTKKKRIVNSRSESPETDSEVDNGEENVPHKTLGLDLSESENEEDTSVRQVDSRVSKRVAKEASNVTADSSEDEGPRRDLDDNEEVGGNDFERMMQKKKAENRRFRFKISCITIN